MERAGLPSAFVGVQARFVDWLIHRSLRGHFRAIYVQGAPPAEPKPIVLFANHHYWWDGYLGYWLIRAWGRRALVWMEAYRRFPPFWALGALPFPPDNIAMRARTIRRTLTALQSPETALLLFPEGVLHGDPQRLLPFQRSLYWLAQRAAHALFLPLAIHIEPSYHQYPRAYLSVGKPFTCELEEAAWLQSAAQTLQAQLRALQADARHTFTEAETVKRGYQVLLRGRRSLHERF